MFSFYVGFLLVELRVGADRQKNWRTVRLVFKYGPQITGDTDAVAPGIFTLEGVES